MKKKRISRNLRENLIGYSFVGIWIIGFLVFMFYPLINSIIYSLSEVKITGTGIVISFQGLKNFQNIFQLEEGFN
ncbi:MAG: sugar ABC transporter permease, partial [Bacilli bacterium]|nr:sugar ABC transporter permease [Bacilli bacterium]